MKIVTKGKIPHPILSHVFVSDLDRLEEISAAAASASPDDLAKLSDEFSAIIFHLRIGSFHKRTRAGRLVQTERAFARSLQGGHGDIDFLDLGASDCVTSCELVDALELALGRRCRAIAVDLYQSLNVFAGGECREYRTADGMPVLVRKGRFALQLPQSEGSRDFVRNWLARRYMARRSNHPEMRLMGKISLVSPRVLRSQKVVAIEKSILDEDRSWHGRFDAIRASNVLNPRFFSAGERRKSLGFIHSYLKQDGVLVISRNHSEKGREIERGSLWRRFDDGFSLVEDFGGGSELKSDVEEFGLARLRA